MIKFVYKHIQKKTPFSFEKQSIKNYKESKLVDNVEKKEEKIIKEKDNSVMTTQEKINAASEILAKPNVKRIVKKRDGLIERTESSATILTEDNKELLND